MIQNFELKIQDPRDSVHRDLDLEFLNFERGWLVRG